MAVDGDGRKWLPREKVMPATPGGNNRRIADQSISRKDPPFGCSAGVSLRGAPSSRDPQHLGVRLALPRPYPQHPGLVQINKYVM